MRRTLPIVQRIAITLLCAIVFRGLARSQELTSQEVLPSLGEQFVQYPIAATISVLFDAQGRIVRTGRPATWELSALPAGCYHLRVC
ncbi:MAG: hypothetical protein H6591_14080 [Flavobacteriales bacterium]|nr:hypothetical protein [Flavobacteriales bacterium]